MKIKIATAEDYEEVINIRLEMVKDVNSLGDTYQFDAEFIRSTKAYFNTSSQVTVLAKNDEVIGCATLCLINLMPTYDHPNGKRAHIMNVFTKPAYRGQGVAYQMLLKLIEVAKEEGVSELSLDATEAGRKLYEKCGFTSSEEGMVLIL